MDIKLFHNPGELSLGNFDIKRSGLALVTDETLETAVIISLFTDRRARSDDKLPYGTSQGGWWGDTLTDIPGDQIGSRLWLLYREKTTDETLNRAREYCIEALQWLIEDAIASRVQVETAYLDRTSGIMTIDIVVTKLSESIERYNLLWRHLFPDYQEAASYDPITQMLTEGDDYLLAESGQGLITE